MFKIINKIAYGKIIFLKKTRSVSRPFRNKNQTNYPTETKENSDRNSHENLIQPQGLPRQYFKIKFANIKIKVLTRGPKYWVTDIGLLRRGLHN